MRVNVSVVLESELYACKPILEMKIRSMHTGQEGSELVEEQLSESEIRESFRSFRMSAF